MPQLRDVKRWAAWQHRRHRRSYGPNINTVPLAVTFPDSALISKAWIALVPDFTRPWWEWNWAEITDYVRWDPGVSTSQGRRDQDGQPTASNAQATLDNSDGRFSRLNPYSPYYGLLTPFTPIRFEVDPGSGFSGRYFGHVNSWPKRWDRSANDPTIPITCRGPLHRILRSQPLRSSMYRSIAGVAANDYIPHAYWPMEDGETATQFASGLAGGPPMTIAGSVTMADDTQLTGSQPLPFFGDSTTATGLVPAYTATGQWVFQIAAYIAAEPLSDVTIATIYVTGSTFAKWEIAVTASGASGDLFIAGYDSAGVLLLGATTSVDDDDFYGQWQTISLAVYPSGSDLAGTLFFFNGRGTSFGPFGSTEAGASAGVVTQIVVGGTESFSAGHAALFVDANFDPDTDVGETAAAMYGYSGEQAHERIARLCREANITLRSDTTSSTTLGPQQGDRLISVLQDAAKAAQGVLYEHEFGLGFQDIRNRENQPIALTVDIADGQVVEDLEPADDDLQFHNQWTASRPAGSEATVQTPGGLGDSDLLYDGSGTFDVETDSQLLQLASWLVHADTIQEDRWPNVAINLAKHPELIPAWIAMPYGARINVTNLMSEAGIDTIDAIVEGYDEAWNSKQWSARMNTSPASVYTVGLLDSSDRRLDSATSTLASAISDSATSLSVATTDSRDLWTTDAAEMPFDIEIWPGPPPDTSGGEVMTVTAVAGATSPQTFTVTRAVNGVAKAHAAGAEVHVRNPFVLAL